MNDENENFDIKQDEKRLSKIVEKRINDHLECQVLMQFYASNA